MLNLINYVVILNVLIYNNLQDDIYSLNYTENLGIRTIRNFTYKLFIMGIRYYF